MIGEIVGCGFMAKYEMTADMLWDVMNVPIS